MKFVMTSAAIIDLAANNGALEQESTLLSAAIISLLTDRRANADDELPNNNGRTSAIPADRRGWVGDALADNPSFLIGSRLWLLAREKQTEEVRKRAVFYCEEALQWMIDDGHAKTVEIQAEWVEGGRLNVKVAISLVEGGLFSFALLDVTGETSAI